MKLNPDALTKETSVLLNVIRIFACELVVVSHYITTYQPQALSDFYLGGLMGGVGVFIFFAISGFLISYSLLVKLQNKNYSFRHYLIDRFSRIYSGLLIALVFIACVAAAIYYTNGAYYNSLANRHSPPSLQSLLATVSMTMSYPSGALNSSASVLNLPSAPQSVSAFGLDSVLWSLGVEWWLYMFFGWLIIGSLGYFEFRSRRRGYKPFFVAVAALLTVILLGWAWDFGAFIAVWFLGVLVTLAISIPKVREKLSSGKTAVALIVLLFASLASTLYLCIDIYTVTHESFSPYLGLSVLANVAFLILLVNGKNLHRLNGFLKNRKVASTTVAFTAFSYTLFLIHYPMILLLNGFNFAADRWLTVLPVILLINQTAFLLSYIGERRSHIWATKIKAALHFTV